MTDQLTLGRSSRTYATPYDPEEATALHSRLKKNVPTWSLVEHATEDWSQFYVGPSDWALIEDGDSTYSTLQSRVVLAANTSQAISRMYTDELLNVVIVYDAEDNEPAPELEWQKYRNLTSEMLEPSQRHEIRAWDRVHLLRFVWDGTASAATASETLLARRLRKMKLQYPLMQKQFDDAIEFAEGFPDTLLAPSVWTDNEAEVVLEWILPEKRHAVISFEGDGQFGYALRFGDQFFPGKASGRKPFSPPSDLVRYISEK